MKVNLLAYGITGVIAVAAGVAIAGLPSDPADTIVVDPGSVTTTITSIPVVTTVPPAPATDPVETDPVTTPAPTSTIAATTTIAPTTTSTATTAEATTTTSEPPLRAPSSISIAVVNATDAGGVARDLADVLEELGYSQISTADSLPAEVTAVYAAEGYEREAQQLLVDAGLDEAPILPIDEAPEITATGDFPLILVLGLDAV